MNHGSGTRGPKDKVTMKTIAEEAGVTLTTVSRILNQKGDKYAESTRKQIFEIADRLKYRPNALVHGMQTGQTGCAGVMIPVDDPFYSQVVAGIHEAFVSHDTIMLLGWNLHSLSKEDEVRERHIIHQMIDRRVEGILLRPSTEEFERSYFEEIWERDIPLILVDREMSKMKSDFVGTDDQLGGKLAAELLISLGHRRMLFLGDELASTSRRRETGFRKVLSETPDAYCQSIAVDEATTWDELRQRLSSSEPPTALFCYNDDIARRAATEILAAGLSIPDDVSLVGFGNVPSADFGIPLTTFDQHPREIGITAAQLYQDRTRGKNGRGVHHEVIRPDLLVRASTRAIA